MGLPSWLNGKEFSWQCRRCRFNPWVRKIPWRREWLPTPTVHGVTKSWTQLSDFHFHQTVNSRGKQGLPWWLSGKEPTCQCRRGRFNPWVRKIPWSRQWQPTPVFLPGRSHGQRSLTGYSPWGHRRVGLYLATKTAKQTV